MAFNAGALMVCGMVMAFAAILTFIHACCCPRYRCCQKGSKNAGVCACVHW